MLIWLTVLFQLCNDKTSSLLGSLCEKQLDFRNYFRLCDTIRADEQIKSMFRLEGKAIDCPLTVNSNPPNPGGKNTNTAFQLTYRYFTDDDMAVSLRYNNQGMINLELLICILSSILYSLSYHL